MAIVEKTFFVPNRCCRNFGSSNSRWPSFALFAPETPEIVWILPAAWFEHPDIFLETGITASPCPTGFLAS